MSEKQLKVDVDVCDGSSKDDHKRECGDCERADRLERVCWMSSKISWAKWTEQEERSLRKSMVLRGDLEERGSKRGQLMVVVFEDGHESRRV